MQFIMTVKLLNVAHPIGCSYNTHKIKYTLLTNVFKYEWYCYFAEAVITIAKGVSPFNML